MSDRIYRTVYQVEVFSQGPFQLHAMDDDDPFDLVAINYAITEGDCIGQVEMIDSEVVAPDLVKTELLRIGNDGTFFDTDEWLEE